MIARLARRRDERGSLAPAMPVLAFMLLVLAGLGIDGSRALNARGEAVAYAEEAARAGAQQVDLDDPGLKLKEDDAMAAAQRYCDAAMRAQPKIVISCAPTGIDPVGGGDDRKLVVKVECSTQVDTMLLDMVGIRTLHAKGAGKARPYEGIDKPLDPQDQQDQQNQGGGTGGGTGGGPGGGAGGGGTPTTP